MDAFNIHIPYDQEQITLTILPVEGGFQVIYYGRIAALVRQGENAWEKASLASTDLGDLPLYDPDAFPENPPFLVSDEVIAAIGQEIDIHLQTIEH
ncbi:hypothetical protein [Pedobacter sp. SYP-B3415]|uniref:hypothetical protein n=1 Tax=Pedobacter sp. SYP-B3415 TaxID=2496641 RepID=UPI00101BC131|nr:hypothetical protein [Pedobacter sp. SYP-B3415]